MEQRKPTLDDYHVTPPCPECVGSFDPVSTAWCDLKSVIITAVNNLPYLKDQRYCVSPNDSEDTFNNASLKGVISRRLVPIIPESTIKYPYPVLVYWCYNQATGRVEYSIVLPKPNLPKPNAQVDASADNNADGYGEFPE